MQDLKPIIANNISELRKASKMTQIELADKLNYSDKAISKWERGDSIPDINVLCCISELFGVTVDYLVKPHESDNTAPIYDEYNQRSKHHYKVITLISCALVWLIATVIFVILNLAVTKSFETWMSFVYAVPVTCIVLLVFNSIWGDRRHNYYIISVLSWSVLISIYLTLIKYNIWLVFAIGIPSQIIIILWSRLHYKK